MMQKGKVVPVTVRKMPRVPGGQPEVLTVTVKPAGAFASDRQREQVQNGGIKVDVGQTATVSYMSSAGLIKGQSVRMPDIRGDRANTRSKVW